MKDKQKDTINDPNVLTDIVSVTRFPRVLYFLSEHFYTKTRSRHVHCFLHTGLLTPSCILSHWLRLRPLTRNSIYFVPRNRSSVSVNSLFLSVYWYYITWYTTQSLYLVDDTGVVPLSLTRIPQSSSEIPGQL